MSAPPDPARAARAAAEADDAAAAEDEARLAAGPARATSIDALRAQGDADGLIALARAYRSGTAGMDRDLTRCFEAYAAAADLGSPLAQHALGLFHLHGGPVPPDDMEAAKRFRAAADAGHLAAKVYIANFYELGIHYRADPAKSDVWHRNVARSAGIEAEPGSPEHDRALAELGCVRFAIALADDPSTTAAERARWLRVAKIHGWREGRSSMTAEAMAEAELDVVEREAEARSTRSPTAAAAPAAPRDAGPEPKPDARPSRASRSTGPTMQVGLGLTAFFFALVFMSVAAVAGHLVPPLLAPRGTPLPVLGTRFDLLLPVALGALGVLPTLLVYRVGAVARAIAVGAVGGVVGEVLWGSGHHLGPTAIVQICDLAAGGFLTGLLVFGLLGGAKPGSR